MPQSAFDSRRLSIFRAVAEAGSISAGARRVFLSQPATSAQIQQLEQKVGRALFERGARGVRLTAAGAELLDYARRVEALLQEAAAAVMPEKAPVGPLILAASTTIATYIMPQLIADFLKSVGHFSVRLKVGNSTQVIEWVEQGTVPLGLVEGPSDQGRSRIEPYLDDEIVAVVAARPQKFCLPKNAAALEETPIIWRESSSGTRKVVERALRENTGRRPAPLDLEFGSTGAIKEAVLLGLGVGFLPRRAIQAELAERQIVALEIDGLCFQRNYSWVIPGRDLSGLAQRFHRFAMRGRV